MDLSLKSGMDTGIDSRIGGVVGFTRPMREWGCVPRKQERRMLTLGALVVRA